MGGNTTGDDKTGVERGAAGVGVPVEEATTPVRTGDGLPVPVPVPVTPTPEPPMPIVGGEANKPRVAAGELAPDGRGATADSPDRATVADVRGLYASTRGTRRIGRA